MIIHGLSHIEGESRSVCRLRILKAVIDDCDGQTERFASRFHNIARTPDRNLQTVMAEYEIARQI
jgi:hypothetical protein